MRQMPIGCIIQGTISKIYKVLIPLGVMCNSGHCISRRLLTGYNRFQENDKDNTERQLEDVQ